MGFKESIHSPSPYGAAAAYPALSETANQSGREAFQLSLSPGPTQTHPNRTSRAGEQHCVIEDLSFSVILRHSQVRQPPSKGMFK